jgi:YbgC/YbaW family acyl-CoA thioester hydrolase
LGDDDGLTPMDAAQFRCRTPLRVRWVEVDAQGIVFNAHYLTYVDIASTEYWRALGIPYPEGLHGLGGDVYVKKATLEYHRPARFDDDLEVGFCCERIGRTSLTFAWGVLRRGELLVSGELVYVFADPSARPIAVPDRLRSTIEAFEACETMFEVRCGRWAELESEARAIRDGVFVEEQGIDASIEHDGEDSCCTHVVAVTRFGAAVGTARYLELGDAIVKIGRVAVRRGLRGAGVGRLLIESLISEAQQRGFREVVLHAQQSAAGFFERLGFVRTGEAFEEANIPHVAMRLDLSTVSRQV